MEFETILEIIPMVANALPFDIITTVLEVVGGAALIAVGVSKPKSQYKTKAGLIFGTVLNIVGGNFGKAANKE